MSISYSKTKNYLSLIDRIIYEVFPFFPISHFPDWLRSFRK
nr:MAG TPA: hypothetical protein [Caudoviricetes sp.]